MAHGFLSLTDRVSTAEKALSTVVDDIDGRLQDGTV